MLYIDQPDTHTHVHNHPPTHTYINNHMHTHTELLDFIPLSTTIEFLPEQTRHSITLNLVADSTFEHDEYFTVELSSDKEEPVLLLEGSSVSTVVILNDDCKEHDYWLSNNDVANRVQVLYNVNGLNS